MTTPHQITRFPVDGVELVQGAVHLSVRTADGRPGCIVVDGAVRRPDRDDGGRKGLAFEGRLATGELALAILVEPTDDTAELCLAVLPARRVRGR